MRKDEIEVTAIVMKKADAERVSDTELFALFSAFNRMLKIMRSPDGLLVVYSHDDQYQERLKALLPFMPKFEQRRVVVKKRTWQEIKLVEALGSVIR